MPLATNWTNENDCSYIHSYIENDSLDVRELGGIYRRALNYCFGHQVLTGLVAEALRKISP